MVDPDEKVKEIAQRESVKYFSTIDKMLDKIVPEGIIVSTPTELHWSQQFWHLKQVVMFLSKNR